MTRLTQEEAGLIIAEADRLMREISGLRLGQALWLCCGDSECKLSPELSHKLYCNLDLDYNTGYDFFYWVDEHEIMTTFYQRYVEEVL